MNPLQLPLKSLHLLWKIALLCAALFFSTAIARAEHVPGEVLIGIRSGGPANGGAAAPFGDLGQVTGYQQALKVYRLRLRPGLTLEKALADLQRRPGVLYAEPNHIIRALATPNDREYPNQYGPQRVQADLSWEIWMPQAQTVLAIVDTGVDDTHRDLTNVMHRDQQGRVVGYNSLTGSSSARDDHGHGTHVAGIAAAQIDNRTGIAGIAGWNPAVPNSYQYVRVMPVKVLDAGGSGTDASVADGIVWAADQGAKVINLSLGVDAFSNTLDNAVQYAWGRGCVVVAAAGNSGVDQKLYPAAYDNVISVAATDETDTLTDFSQFGSWVKIAAPGLEILSTLPGNLYYPLSGTSMACPHVAGEAAAMRAQNPVLSNAEVSQIILAHVDPYASFAGRKLAQGAGRANVFLGVRAAGTGTPALTSLTVSPGILVGGLPATGTVFLGGRAPAGGLAVALSSSDGTVASVPASVTVPEGATSATFTVTTNSVLATTSVTLTASAGGETRTAALRVRAIAVDAVTLEPASVTGGTSATGTVMLNAPAPSGGAAVALTSSHTGASVPSTVLVAAGTTSATFTITTQPVAATAQAQISASYGGESASATLTILAPVPSIVTLSPATVVGGFPSQGTVTLTGAASAGGLVVALTSSNPSLATVPASVTVPAGASSASFPVSTTSVTAETTVSVSAAAGGTSRSASLTLRPFLASLRLSAGTVIGGTSLSGTVSLNAPAPAGGTVVALASSHTAASVPASVTVPAGASSASFPVDTTPLASDASATITASLAGVTRSVLLTLKAPTVASLTISPVRVLGGSSTTGTVKLTAPAPAGGLTVSLSSDRAAITVPGTMTVAGGATTGTFSIGTSAVTEDTTATITASVNGGKQVAYVTAQPLLQSVRVYQTKVAGGTATSGSVALNAAAPAGGVVVSLASSSGAASVPGTVTVPAGATGASFPISTSPVASSTSVTLFATLDGVTRSVTLTVDPAAASASTRSRVLFSSRRLTLLLARLPYRQ